MQHPPHNLYHWSYTTDFSFQHEVLHNTTAILEQGATPLALVVHVGAHGALVVCCVGRGFLPWGRRAGWRGARRRISVR